jgi:hypothetical protein
MNGYFNPLNGTNSGRCDLGLLVVMSLSNDNTVYFSDQPLTNVLTTPLTTRFQTFENVPDDKDLRLQIRVLNKSTPPSNVSFQIGFASVSNYMPQDVTLQDVKPMTLQGLPVDIVRTITVPVSGTVTANIGTSGLSTFTDSSSNLGINGTFTGTSRDAGLTPSFNIFVASAFANQAGTLRIEKSTNNTVWAKAEEIALLANEAKQITVRVTARYHRVVYVNGGVAQTLFNLTSAYHRI